jgi:hypothetical protein
MSKFRKAKVIVRQEMLISCPDKSIVLLQFCLRYTKAIFMLVNTGDLSFVDAGHELKRVNDLTQKISVRR